MAVLAQVFVVQLVLDHVLKTAQTPVQLHVVIPVQEAVRAVQAAVVQDAQAAAVDVVITAMVVGALA